MSGRKPEDRRHGGGAHLNLKRSEPLGTRHRRSVTSPFLARPGTQRRWGGAGISRGFLIAALHEAGLAMFVHAPSPAASLNEIRGRPATEVPVLLIVVGYPAPGATVPTHAMNRQPMETILSWRWGSPGPACAKAAREARPVAGRGAGRSTIIGHRPVHPAPCRAALPSSPGGPGRTLSQCSHDYSALPKSAA